MAGQSPRRSDWVAGQFFFESTVFADAPGPLALEVRRAEGARARGEVELVLVFNEGRPDERVERRVLALDADRGSYVFDLSGATWTERPAGTALVTEPGASAGVPAQRATGGAR
jgi:hypothetical protein